MVITDQNQDILFFNDKFTELFGYTLDDVQTAEQWWEAAYPDENYRKTVQQSWIDAIEKARVENTDIGMQEWELTIKDHTKRLCEFYMVPLDDVGVIVMKDITHQRRYEEQIKQAQRMESLRNLAGGIAHDFNNILFPIIGMSEMLMEDIPSDTPEYENTVEILKAGKRGRDLVKQILAFSRQTERRLLPVRPHQILTEVLNLARATIPAYIRIAQDIEQDCGLLWADPTQIHQVAMNIITNALHAVEPSGGNITVKLKKTEVRNDKFPDRQLEPGRYVVLSISDDGHGISPNHLSMIFEPYFTTKEKGKGTGLGLAVAFGIIKEHKGEIFVRSEPGKGTTFTIYLPVMNRSVDEKFATAPEPCPTGDASILLVDDEEPIMRLEKQMLERLGYKVSAHASSMEALRAFGVRPDDFDLVISDMSMPNLTGDQLVKELKSIRPDIPVIICTGYSERINKTRAERLGINGFLMKPIVKSKMARTVRKVIDEAGGKVSITLSNRNKPIV